LEVSLAKRISASPCYAARRGGVRSILFLPAAAISAPAQRSSQGGHWSAILPLSESHPSVRLDEFPWIWPLLRSLWGQDTWRASGTHQRANCHDQPLQRPLL